MNEVLLLKRQYHNLLILKANEDANEEEQKKYLYMYLHKNIITEQ